MARRTTVPPRGVVSDFLQNEPISLGVEPGRIDAFTLAAVVHTEGSDPNTG